MKHQSPKQLNSASPPASTDMKSVSMSPLESAYVDVRVDNPHYDFHEVLSEMKSRVMIDAQDLSVLWDNRSLTMEIGVRVERMIADHQIVKKGRLFAISDRLLGIVEEKIDDYVNGVDSPRSLFTGADPYTSNQAKLILKGTLHSLDPKQLADMALKINAVAVSRDGDTGVEDNATILQQVSANYHFYKDLKIDINQFSVDGGFDGVSRAGEVIDIPAVDIDDDDNERSQDGKEKEEA